MASLEQKIAELEAQPVTVTGSEVAIRRQQIDDFLAISSFEGLYPSPLSQRLQKLFAESKLTPVEYITLCKEHSAELGA